MDDTDHRVDSGGCRAVADGGTGDCWQAGEEPPAPPADTEGLVEQFDTDGVRGDRCHVVRVALSAASEEYALRVVEELRKEMDVLGTTLTLDVGPDEPGVFDVLVSMDYEPTTVTSALVEPSEVDAVTIVRPDLAATTGLEADDAAVDEALAAAETAQANADADADPARADADADADSDEGTDDAAGASQPEPDAGDSDSAAAGEAPASEHADADGTADADASGAGADAPEASEAAQPEDTFEELKASTERVGYDDLVAELDETGIPGEFQDEVDLGPLIEDAPEGGDAPPTADPSTAEPRGPGQVASGDGGKQLAPPAGELDADRVVEALVTAVEEDALDDEQRRTIADAFDVGPPKTLLVRIDHLQREVDELTAYKESLEGFIDEYGTGGGLVEQIRAALGEFTEDVAALESELAELDGRVAELDDRTGTVDELADRVDRQSARVDELAGVTDRVDAVERELAAVEDLGALADRVEELAAATSRVEELDDVAERVDELEEVATRVRALERLSARARAIDSLEERLEVMQSELDAVRATAEAGADGDLDERLTAMEEEVSALGARISVVESETVDAVDDLSQDVERVEDRLAAIEEWRERISTLLAGE